MPTRRSARIASKAAPENHALLTGKPYAKKGISVRIAWDEVSASLGGPQWRIFDAERKFRPLQRALKDGHGLDEETRRLLQEIDADAARGCGNDVNPATQAARCIEHAARASRCSTTAPSEIFIESDSPAHGSKRAAKRRREASDVREAKKQRGLSSDGANDEVGDIRLVPCFHAVPLSAVSSRPMPTLRARDPAEDLLLEMYRSSVAASMERSAQLAQNILALEREMGRDHRELLHQMVSDATTLRQGFASD